MRGRATTSTRLRAALGVVAVATTVGIGLAPIDAHARQYRCEHPTDGYCLAVDSTKLVSCVCHGETTEVDRDDLRMADNQQMMDICWEVWSDVCSAWSEAPVTCDEPGLGTCEIDGRDGGSASCACEDGRMVDEPEYDVIGGLAGEALEAECPDTLATLCTPPPPPPPVTPVQAPVADPEPRAQSCAVITGRDLDVTWSLLLLVAAWRRRPGRPHT